jgi:hypothetical protein
MKHLVLEPSGWPCTLQECPPGLFVFYEHVGLKTEYGDVEAYCGDSGEYFWAGTHTKAERNAVIVQPVSWRWDESEEE